MLRVLPASLLLSLLVALPGAARPFAGPFALNDGMTFYLVNDSGQGFRLNLTLSCFFRKEAPYPTLVRVFDPAERLLVRRELPGELMTPPQPEPLSLDIPAAGPGVYQVIVHSGATSASWGRTDVALQTTPELEFGIFGHLQWLTCAANQFSDSFVYLPPGLST